METVSFEGKQVSHNAIIEAIKEFGSYPVFQIEDQFVRMKVLPSNYSVYADGSIGFGLNGGSFNPKAPQMNVVRIEKDAVVLEVDETLLPIGLQDSVKSVKPFFIQTHSEGYYMIAYFPKHMIKGADFPTGRIKSRVKQVRNN